ncbi:hypothetical protein [Paenibacillus arenilitoris]|uniref:Uncharacterized protein n=1 Tax=Paenibacillus arenilitoris TaxID=2772299 RepID=A0A927CFP9_9BACL|nr:hypothetical protein [Paenibacillus arenilitoris]MBD2867238.1 hypothetical protein [Paenibacillus arenilitoris]
MKNSTFKKRALWFINTEIERVLLNLKSGAVNREHAMGSLNTLYHIASAMRDSDAMINLCKIIDRVRDTDERLGILHIPEISMKSYY